MDRLRRMEAGYDARGATRLPVMKASGAKAAGGRLKSGSPAVCGASAPGSTTRTSCTLTGRPAVGNPQMLSSGPEKLKEATSVKPDAAIEPAGSPDMRQNHLPAPPAGSPPSLAPSAETCPAPPPLRARGSNNKGPGCQSFNATIYLQGHRAS